MKREVKLGEFVLEHYSALLYYTMFLRQHGKDDYIIYDTLEYPLYSEIWEYNIRRTNVVDAAEIKLHPDQKRNMIYSLMKYGIKE